MSFLSNDTFFKEVMQEKAEQSAFFALLKNIHECATLFTRSGVTPTEVWLGPKEARILEAVMRIGESALIRSGMEGSYIRGLLIRWMTTDGLRVGVSCALDNNNDKPTTND